ncbi:hypothetical protein D3C87_102990 [compost metagenome]
MKTVTVLIGDIDASREIAPKSREKIQRDLEKIFSKLNEDYSKEIVSPLKLTLGDEFQALFLSPYVGWKIIQEIEISASKMGLSLRYALSYDVLHTSINKVEPLSMDGPAFWEARALIEKKASKYSFHIREFSFNSTLQVLGKVLDTTRNDWTDIQTKYVYHMLETENSTASETARYFDKSPSTVHRMLKTTKIDLYQEVWDEVGKMLRESVKI